MQKCIVFLEQIQARHEKRSKDFQCRNEVFSLNRERER